MPKAHPSEFREPAIEMARMREKLEAQIVSDLGILESVLRRWMDMADVKDGHKPGLDSEGRAELVRLRREKLILETEIEILKRASAYFSIFHPGDVRLLR